jgi:hypothetical protein
MSLLISQLPLASSVNGADQLTVNQGSPATTRRATLQAVIDLISPTPPTAASNLVYAGPVSGPSAAPTFRALVAADVPSIAVDDEGVPVVTTVSALDFVGAGVTVTSSSPGVATVTVPGASTPTPFALDRTSDFAIFGGNGANINTSGMPNPSPGSAGVAGQAPAVPTSGNLWQKLTLTQFTANGADWNILWGSNWKPFIRARSFSWAVMFHDRVVATATNQYSIGFGDSGAQSTTPPESVNTNFFGFSFRVSPATTVQRVLRLAGVSSVVDTGVALPTAAEVWRAGIAGDGANIVFTLEKMNADFSFTTVYSSSVAISAVTDVVYQPVYGGPAAGLNGNDLYIARGTYSV